MLCPYCGTENKEGAGFCISCRRTIEPDEWLRPQATPPPSAPQQPWSTQYYDRAPYQQPMYMFAAFWPRVGAWILDFLFATLLAAIPGAILAILLAVAVSSAQREPQTFREERNQDDNVAVAAVAGFLLGYYPVYVAYFTIANAKGGGWGKRIVGLRIMRHRDGRPPGYGTGFLRALIPILLYVFISFLWLLDQLWCIWDSQKQTWHDKIAGTIVVVAR